MISRKDKRKGSENRQKSGAREKNVGHKNGEEHSRVPKGSNGKAKKAVETVATTTVVIGAGYLIYRGGRMLPSLCSPLWWTLPINAVTP